MEEFRQGGQTPEVPVWVSTAQNTPIINVFDGIFLKVWFFKFLRPGAVRSRGLPCVGGVRGVRVGVGESSTRTMTTTRKGKSHWSLCQLKQRGLKTGVTKRNEAAPTEAVCAQLDTNLWLMGDLLVAMNLHTFPRLNGAAQSPIVALSQSQSPSIPQH